VTARNPDAKGRPDPLAFGTDLEPLYYARVTDGAGGVVTSKLSPSQFHPGFSRIRF